MAYSLGFTVYSPQVCTNSEEDAGTNSILNSTQTERESFAFHCVLELKEEAVFMSQRGELTGENYGLTESITAHRG